MSELDYTLIGAYLAGILAIGMVLGKRASKDLESYFLGGRSMPWWALGASGMASNLDISGTMIIVAFLYAVGAQGFFIEIRGGVVLIMAFLMVFSGKWIRRSGAMTNAEWMQFRFGEGRQGSTARLLNAAGELIFTTAAVTYFVKGAGKFIGEFIGVPDETAALLMIAVATIYTVASGLYGVVVTDVVQGALIAAAIVVVAGYVIVNVTLPESFLVSAPLGDGGFTSIQTTAAKWTSIQPSWTEHLPGSYSIYNLFGVSVFFYLFLVIIQGSGGTGGYMAQRFYAAKNEREVRWLSGFWIFLLSFRWPFAAAIAMLGVTYAHEHGLVLDPERVLPIVINEFFPPGLKGFVVAAFLAAAMSTFDSIINGGTAYWVRDVYQRYLNPQADQRTLVRAGRAASFVIVALGILFSYSVRSINEIWGWLTMSVGAGLVVPLFLRWYWWRVNGYGFAAGTFAGMASAVVQKLVFPSIPEYASFLAVASLSTAALVVASLLTSPTDEGTLRKFYTTTRPFGLWSRIRVQLGGEAQRDIRREHLRDLASLAVAVPWQLTLFLFMMQIVMKQWTTVAWLGGLLVLLSVALWHFLFKSPRRTKSGKSRTHQSP